MYSNTPHYTQIAINVPEHIDNTPTAKGFKVHYSPSKKDVSYASGFLLRGDSREPAVIFRNGFRLSTSITTSNADYLTGDAFGCTSSVGVSTTASFFVAASHSSGGGRPIRTNFYSRGNVYLIDLRGILGFVIKPSQSKKNWLEDNTIYGKEEDEITKGDRFSYLFYEVNFIAGIPSDSIVGSLGCHRCSQYILTCNPDYEGSIGEIVSIMNDKKLYEPEYIGAPL